MDSKALIFLMIFIGVFLIIEPAFADWFDDYQFINPFEEIYQQSLEQTTYTPLSGGSIEISECSVLDQAGETYLLTADIIDSDAEICMNIIANNVTFDCQGHLIDGNDSWITIATEGIKINEVSNIIIRNCSLSNWDFGIRGNNCENVSVLSSNITTVYEGVRLEYCLNNNIYLLDISNQYENAGIVLYYSNNSVISHSKIHDSYVDLEMEQVADGIYLFYGYNNSIFSNNISNQSSFGVDVIGGNNSIFSNNIFNNERGYTGCTGGIYLQDIGDNTIFNNFFNNTLNVKIQSPYPANHFNTTQQSGTRIYSDGTQIGGNYWTNSTSNGYSDTCTDVDTDGFCDEPYTLAENNIDYLPYSDEYSAGVQYNITSSLTIGLSDSKSKIFNGVRISNLPFTMTSESLRNVIFQRISDVQMTLFESVSSVLIDGNSPTYSLNSTNSTLAGTLVSHNLFWQDNVNLNGYIFSFFNGTNTTYCDGIPDNCEDHLTEETCGYDAGCEWNPILNMTLITTYQDNNGDGTIEGARGMQIDSTRKLAFISSNTDDALTALNYSDPTSITLFGTVTDSSPPCSIDGIYYGVLNNDNIFFAPSSTDDQTSWYNVTTGTFACISNTTVDTAGSGSQEEEYSVIIVNAGKDKWLVTGGRTDSYISTFNMTTLTGTKTVAGCFTDTSGAGSIEGMYYLFNVPSTSYFLVASTVDDYVTVGNVTATGAVASVGSGYTDSADANSIDGLEYFYYEPSTQYLYVPSPLDGYLTILDVSGYASGTITAVGSVGGLTAPVSVAVGTVGSDKYAFVGSKNSNINITVINVTNPASPTIFSVFSQTSGTCVYNGVYSLNVVNNYLFATSGVDACFYSIELGTAYVCSGTPDPCGTYNASQTNCERVSCDWNNFEEMVNDTWEEMTGTTNWSNVTKTITSQVGATIKWCVYANDTSDNWNSTSCDNPFSYLTTTIAGNVYNETGSLSMSLATDKYRILDAERTKDLSMTLTPSESRIFDATRTGDLSASLTENGLKQGIFPRVKDLSFSLTENGARIYDGTRVLIFPMSIAEDGLRKADFKRIQSLSMDLVEIAEATKTIGAQIYERLVSLSLTLTESGVRIADLIRERTLSLALTEDSLKSSILKRAGILSLSLSESAEKSLQQFISRLADLSMTLTGTPSKIGNFDRIKSLSLSLSESSIKETILSRMGTLSLSLAEDSLKQWQRNIEKSLSITLSASGGITGTQIRRLISFVMNLLERGRAYIKSWVEQTNINTCAFLMRIGESNAYLCVYDDASWKVLIKGIE